MKSVLIKIFFIVVLAVALWAVLGWRDQAQPGTEQEAPQDSSIDPSNEMLFVIHTYENGIHTLKGTISLPTPCHDLTTEAIVMESYPERVNINFTTIDSGEICIQVIDERNFSVDFQASPKPVIVAFLDGKPLSLIIDDQSGTLKP